MDKITDNRFNNQVSHLDDDYYYWKSEQESLIDPLSDDYCKYFNE